MAYPTNPIYKLVKNLTGVVDQVSKESNNIKVVIPFVEDNAKYQEYLAWKADGGVPEEAD